MRDADRHLIASAANQLIGPVSETAAAACIDNILAARAALLLHFRTGVYIPLGKLDFLQFPILRNGVFINYWSSSFFIEHACCKSALLRDSSFLQVEGSAAMQMSCDVFISECFRYISKDPSDLNWQLDTGVWNGFKRIVHSVWFWYLSMLAPTGALLNTKLSLVLP